MNLKIKIILIIIFIVLYGLFFVSTSSNKNSRITSILNEHINNLEIQQSIINNYFENDAKIIKDNICNNKDIVNILNKASNSTKKDETNLRNELFVLLNPLYNEIKRKGILQLHFVSTKNITFLRMHKPLKYGDDLTKVRDSYTIVNKNKSIVKGFEQGKSAHAYRYVFPIFNKNKKHIASAEISLNTEFIQNKLRKLNKIHTHFIVNKKIFDAKKWSDEKLLLKYIPSIENEDYMLSIVDGIYYKEQLQREKLVVDNIKDKITYNLKSKESFAIEYDLKNITKIITFIPVKNIKDNDVVAYLISYSDNTTIHDIYLHFYIKNIIVFIILLILLVLLYFNKLNELSRIKKSEKVTMDLIGQINAFDKNVIFSKTDLRGNITYASEAFCKMSGYSKEELLNKPHNMIRHEDMPHSAFANLWETIKSGKTWTGEVKNKKKNGDFYWVKSRVELDYNKKGKHIGYYAVRHVITAQKKVEELKAKLESTNCDLEDKVNQRTKEILQLNEEIQDTQKEVVFTMGAIGETRSEETGNHVKRVAQYSKILALHYGIDEKDAEMLKQASPMHDIGKVGIPDSILNKPGRFDEAERKIMETHAQLGYDMLKHSNRDLLKLAAVVSYEHHEKWDGTGYPNRLKGKEISIYGRITAIADVFDALGSDRIYKKAWDDEKILKLFKDERGKQFDPDLVDIFLENISEFLIVRDTLRD